jgi:hypothetical protein
MLGVVRTALCLDYVQDKRPYLSHLELSNTKNYIFLSQSFNESLLQAWCCTTGISASSDTGAGMGKDHFLKSIIVLHLEYSAFPVDADISRPGTGELFEKSLNKIC